jgi:hypothetical protein
MSAPKPRNAEKDAGMQPALMGVAISAVVLTGGAFAFFDARTGVGVLFGGATATANLWVMARVARAFLAQKGHAAPWVVIAVLKLVALLIGVWLVLRSGAFSPIALVVGYGSLPLGITLGSLFAPPPEDDPAPIDPEAALGDPAAISRGQSEGSLQEDVLEGGPPKGDA